MLVTDRRRLAADEPTRCATLVELAGAAARGGVGLIQIRERDLEDGRLLALIRDVVGAVEGTGTRVVVNDRPDLAIAGRAHGVHLPADGVPAARVRGLLPDDAVLGRSIHSSAEAGATETDYVVFGTVYETGSKPAGHPVAGAAALAAACREAAVPVLAIGGVTPARFDEIARAGAAGFAAIGLFVDCRTESAIAAVVRDFRAAYAGARHSLSNH
jgi:thiamine-phosphate pyrophosphorylase